MVADWAIEWVIDKQKFHYALAAFFNELSGGADAHVFADRIRASDDWTRHPANIFITMIVTRGFLSRSGARGHAHLHETHTAVAGSRKFRMITIVRHFHLHRAAGFDHTRPARELVPNAVDLHVDHAFFGSEVFGKLDFRRGRCGVAHGKNRCASENFPQRADYGF